MSTATLSKFLISAHWVFGFDTPAARYISQVLLQIFAWLLVIQQGVTSFGAKLMFTVNVNMKSVVFPMQLFRTKM